MKPYSIKAKKFIMLYVLYLSSLFLILYAPTSSVSTTINNFQTNLTLQTISLFLKDTQIRGIDIWVNPYYKIIITQACNGMIPTLFLVSSILAYPSKFIMKILWIIVGYIVYIIANVLRLILVIKVTKIYGSNSFYWIHDIVGNALLIGVGFMIFTAFIKTSQTTT